MSAVRRVGANGGWLSLLGLLCLAASLLLTASPRVANRYTDQGLHEWVSSQPYRVRDVTYVLRATCAVGALGYWVGQEMNVASFTMLVQGSTVGFTIVGVAETFPGLGTANARFVVLPWQALPATRVLTGAQVRDDLERGGVDHVLGYTFMVGLAAGLALALLAVGFSVASGARARGQALSWLRTMGLSTEQGRRVLAYELLPLIALGALVGSVVGLVLPTVVGPALGLSAFSDGGDVEFVFDPRLPGLGFALVVVAVVLAMAVEEWMNRRARLGVVLRVGGER